MRRTPVALATLCLLLGQTIFAGAVSGADPSKFTATQLNPVSTFSTPKSTSGAIAKSDPKLLGRHDATPVNVVIKYDFDASATYTGGVNGLAATSPRVTGKSLKANAAAVKAYDAYTAKLTKGITAAAQKAAPSLKVNESFGTAYGGVSGRVTANQIAALLKVPGVVAVQSDTLEQPLDDNTGFIGATAVWPSLGGSATAGSNVIFGDIDTGVWPEHPMLAPGSLSAPAGGLKACQFGDGTDTADLGPTFTCNNKLIGAYAKMANYMANTGAGANEFCNNTSKQCSARDPEGHGTHTTTTAAGDCVTTAMLYGAERGPVCGIAPGAHVIEYRVCAAAGCFGSDSVSAINQAIADGVNVINYSISGGGSPYTDAVELAFLDAVHAGISVNASAGNSGPTAGTSDHGGPWVTTVGASTGPRSFSSTLHLTADGGATLDIAGVTLTNGITTATPVVMAATLAGEDALCQSTLAAGTAAGKIVVCNRGVNGRIDKGRRVAAGGAAGMILTNNSAAVTDLESDNHYLPAIQVQFNSNAVATFVTSHTNVMATWAQGTAEPAQADVMASFSSRGPTGDWIKPDVTAPGVQVLAGTTPQPDQTTADNGPTGNLYMAIAGTSMSSPHSAGVSILVKAAHPTWTPEEIKSALMTSSVQDVVKEDGTTPADPFDMGAGSIRADRAVDPTLVFDENFADFNAAGADPLHRIDLNIPSIDATTMTGEVTTTRTAINVSGKAQDLKVSVQSPDNTQIIVSGQKPNAKGVLSADTKLHADKNKPVTFWVRISAPTADAGQYFGRITLTPKNGTPVTIPVAFIKKQGAVSLTNTCTPSSIAAKTGLSHCTVTATNFAQTAANVDVNVANLDNVKGLKYSNIAAPATAIGHGDGVTWSGALSGAIPPQIDGFTATEGPGGGYLPLSAFGVTPLAGVGDDTVTNIPTGTFFYGGEPYTSIGVSSNGYVVIGGGTAADSNFAPQSFPNTARPNNTIAMFWTDLNPSAAGGGAIRAATLSDSSAGLSWVVIDFGAVKNFSNATTHTGELWFQLASGSAGSGPSSEQITMTFGAANASAGDPDESPTLPINWGAENRDGTSGKNFASAPANNTEWSVDTSPPAAGGSATLHFDVSASKAGTYSSVASMTSDVTPGTTQVVQAITVRP